jgi:hypothetical protein
MKSFTKHPRLLLAAVVAAGAILALPGCHRGQNSAADPPGSAKVAPRPAGPPPLPDLPPGGVKGIYLTGWTAGVKRFHALVGLVDRTELNAMVIDVKDDGQVSYGVDVPLVREIKANRRMFKVGKIMATLNAHHIFPIARIACMRDTPLAEAHPEMAVHDSRGRVWHDRTHHAWLNPYNRKVWDYNVDVALDAIKHGFKEIQFDYVRFPSEGDLAALQYPGKPANSLREDQIAAFLQYAREKIRAQGAWFSADIFGLTSLVKDDEGIGQKFGKVAQQMDYLCPMVYPSHYHKGEYGIPNPNAEPYKIIHLSVGDAQKRLKEVATCKLRPWIQDFNLGVPHYGPKQVKAEIKALRDLGIQEFLVWNAKCKYTESAFARDTPPRIAAAPPGPTPTKDTPKEATRP